MVLGKFIMPVKMTSRLKYYVASKLILCILCIYILLVKPKVVKVIVS